MFIKNYQKFIFFNKELNCHFDIQTYFYVLLNSHLKNDERY